MRLYWLDDTDFLAARRQLRALRRQFADWRWVKWIEDEHSPKDAYGILYSEIFIPTMFGSGKGVYFYGLPKCHANLAKDLANIPPGMTLVIIAKPNRTFSLWKQAKKMEEKGLASIVECTELSHASCYQWVAERAREFNLKIDEAACKKMTSLVGLSRNKMTMEFRKLRYLAGDDGIITPWAIEQSCEPSSDADSARMCSAIVDGDGAMAHSMLDLMLRRREPPLRIMSFLAQWVTKMALIEQNEYNDDRVKGKAALLKKWVKNGEEEKASDKAEGEDDGEAGPYGVSGGGDKKVNGGRSVPLYANLGQFHWSSEDLTRANRGPGWAQDALWRLHKVQLEVRTNIKNEQKVSQILHEYIADLLA